MLVYNERKIERLREKSHQAFVTYNDLSERIRDKKSELKRLEMGPHNRPGSLSQDEAWQKIREAQEPVEKELAFLDEELERANVQKNAITPVVRDVDEWLAERKRQGYKVQPDPDPNFPDPITDDKRSKAHKRLQEVREQIDEALSRRDQVASAPLTPAEVKDRLTDWVDRQAERAEYRQAVNIASKSDRRMGDTLLQPEVIGNARADVVPLLAFACGDMLKDRLASAVDGLVDTERAVSADDRQAKLAEIDGELNELGREEESIITALEAAGETIARRSEADMAIVAEVREVEDPPKPEGKDPRDSADMTRVSYV